MSSYKTPVERLSAVTCEALPEELAEMLGVSEQSVVDMLERGIVPDSWLFIPHAGLLYQPALDYVWTHTGFFDRYPEIVSASRFYK